MAVCILGQVGNSPGWCCCPAIGGGRRIGGLGFGGRCWCICESRRQSKVGGCSDLQGTVEPGRNLYSILASAVLDQTNDQSWQARGEKKRKNLFT